MSDEAAVEPEAVVLEALPLEAEPVKLLEILNRGVKLLPSDETISIA